MTSQGRLARATVSFAAATLPGAVRARYREQWTADLRDAYEAGLRPGQIARAALVFSATFARPWPALPTRSPAEIARRERVALALGFTVALLGLSRFAYTTPMNQLTGGIPPGFALPAPLESIAGALDLFAVIVPVLAVLVVALTRGVSVLVRVLVLALVVASCAPLVEPAIDGWGSPLLTPRPLPGTLAYLVAALLTTGVAIALLRTRVRPTKLWWWTVPVALVAGAAVTGSVLAGTALGRTVWAHRRPVVWVNGTSAGPANTSNRLYLQWLDGWRAGNAAVESTFAWWVVLGIALGALVVLVTIALRLSLRAQAVLLVGMITAIVLASMGLLLVLETDEPGTVDLVTVEQVLVAARLVLVFVALIAGIGAVLATTPGASSKARRASRRAALP